MAITIYKIAYHVDWDGTGVARPRAGGVYGGSSVEPVDLSNYYTKENLFTADQSEIHFANIIEAEHNNLLGLQGGDDDSSGDSSGYIGDYYHLDEATYYDIVGIDFQMSIEKDGANVVTLVNDETTPGNDKYYGTDSGGSKGWHDLSAGSACLWEDGGEDIITPSDSAGVGIEVDGLLIKDYTIDAQDGVNKDLMIYAGDASGVAGTDAGHLILKAGDAMLGDSDSDQGQIYIVPGNHHTSGQAGYINLGNSSSNFRALYLQAAGSLDNIDIDIQAKGTGQVSLWAGNNITLTAVNGVSIQGELLSVGLDSVDVTFTAYNFNSGKDGCNLTVKGGSVSGGGDWNGGDLYLYGGTNSGSGIIGGIYFGTGAAGKLLAKSSETNVVYYNTTTGLLSYGTVTGGAVLPFQTESFADPLNIDCTTYKDWICTVTDDCTVNLNNVSDGDAGMLELIIEADSSGGEVVITFGDMWTKKMGPEVLDMTDGADNIVSWRAIGEGSTQEIVYTIGVIEV